MTQNESTGPGQLTTMPLDDGDEGNVLAPRLLVLGDGTVQTHVLPRAGRVSIGRAEDAHIQIDRESISRQHAVLHVSDRLELEDVGSSNGTRVGGHRLEPGVRTTITPGEVFELGGVAVLVQGAFDTQAKVDEVAPAMERLRGLAERVARSEISVLVLGETGVGKEVFARHMHALSRRRDRPFVALNCAAFTDQLFESELFGHEAGAFTGATASKPGLLETGQGGTIFLDEVGEVPLAAQVKLLRVLEERQVLRVGALQPRPIDVRFMAATNRDLEREIEAGRFRQDLYYRLNGITLTIPPLRERVSEIAGLARTFAEAAAGRAGIEVPSLSAEALARLETHDWPGNIRELRNVVERAVVLCSDGRIEVEHLFDEAAAAVVAESTSGPKDERSRILDALRECAGNQTRAAKLLGISRKTLGVKMDHYGIARPQKRTT